MKEKKQRPIEDILINILLPILILEKLKNYVDWGEKEAYYILFLALFIPITYGLFEFIFSRTKNYICILGVLNTFLSGVLSLQTASPIWFILKEALFPFLIGCAVLWTAFKENQVIHFLFFQSGLMDEEKIKEEVLKRKKENLFKKLLQKTSFLLSISFFISSLLNFVLAFFIFSPIEALPQSEAYQEILNGQISQMLKYGYLFIALPMSLFTFLIFKVFFSGIKKISNQSWKFFLKDKKLQEKL